MYIIGTYGVFLEGFFLKFLKKKKYFLKGKMEKVDYRDFDESMFE